MSRTRVLVTMFLAGTVVSHGLAVHQSTRAASPTPDNAASEPKSPKQPAIPPTKVAWSGFGKYRLLLQVDAVEIGKREKDEMPAQAEINWEDVLNEIGLKGTVDLRTLQVI